MLIKRILSKEIVEKDLKPKNCYVCLKLIKLEKIYVGKGYYRHEKCVPGRNQWLKSGIKKFTEKFYTKIKKEFK